MQFIGAVNGLFWLENRNRGKPAVDGLANMTKLRLLASTR